MSKKRLSAPKRRINAYINAAREHRHNDGTVLVEAGDAAAARAQRVATFFSYRVNDQSGIGMR